jgi:4-aminobutyrate aminotransferase
MFACEHDGVEPDVLLTAKGLGSGMSIGDVRGLGLMIGIEFVRDRATREPAAELVHDLVQRAFRRGLLILGAGRSTLRLAPPLVIDEYDVDTALAMLDECLVEI